MTPWRTALSPAYARSLSRTFLTLTVLILLAPHILDLFPQTAAFAPPFTWVSDQCMHGTAVLCLVLSLVSLSRGIKAAWAWFSGRPVLTATPVPSPTALEDGQCVTAPDRDDIPPSAPADPTFIFQLTMVYHIGSFIVLAYVPGLYIYQHDVLSPKNSVWQNAVDALVFVLRGLEMGVLMILVVGLVGWLGLPRGRSVLVQPATELPTTAPVMQLTQETAPEEKEFGGEVKL
ncbi:hypothetical protein FB45DRAFT_941231 [Roridomyces roridus]|uniref:Uncharacterized protein n=1 Tax=Roridomyces roridus TaxID=1738132 RepID=A0AAD7B639_9AGAR|nr:hypothetical protein FB45DRAFT_941231 [Roridomyces roridus]